MPLPPTYHSPRSPSGYHRWGHCLGSANAERGLPDVTTRWAAEGTLFHTIMSQLLERPILDPWDFLNERRTIDGHEVVCNEEMVGHLTDGLDYALSLPGAMYVEKRVALDRWMPGESGSLDVGYADLDSDRITILDWKYGMEPVDVVENEQTMLYALGFWNWLVNRFRGFEHIKRFRLIIRQPRVVDGGGVWDTTLSHLLDFAEEAREAHAWSRDPKTQVRSPGKKTCHWCKAKPFCKPHNDYVLDIIGGKLEGIQADPPVTIEPSRIITPEQRSFILLNWPMVKKWHDSLHSTALDDALKGRPVPGLKVIKGRNGPRAWTDEDRAKSELVKMLGRKAIVESILSPTEAEKVITKDEYLSLKGNVTQSDGKPVLVDVNAKGEKLVTYDQKLELITDREED